MLIEVKVPVLPESITEATLVNWHKKAGDSVKRDENLIDVGLKGAALIGPSSTMGAIIPVKRSAPTKVVVFQCP